MMDEFETAVVHTGETSIFVAMSGSGPPILLLHGFPQTHVMWREVAPRLARDFRVVCADLRGYGRSGCPVMEPQTMNVVRLCKSQRFAKCQGPCRNRARRCRYALSMAARDCSTRSLSCRRASARLGGRSTSRRAATH